MNIKAVQIHQLSKNHQRQIHIHIIIPHLDQVASNQFLNLSHSVQQCILMYMQILGDKRILFRMFQVFLKSLKKIVFFFLII